MQRFLSMQQHNNNNYIFLTFKTPSEMPRLRIFKDPHATSPPETKDKAVEGAVHCFQYYSIIVTPLSSSHPSFSRNRFVLQTSMCCA